MNNTELFKFGFVDRTNEKRQLHSFLSPESELSNVLWVNGNSGVGKSFFVEEIVRDYPGYNTFYVDKVKDVSANSYVGRLAKILSESSQLKFLDYLNDNYESIIDTLSKLASSLKSILVAEDFGIVDVCLNTAKKLISRRKEHHGFATVLIKYLDIVSKNKNLIIVLDNFTLCDADSLDVIQEILHHYKTDNRKRFILVTTSEILRDREDILLLISEKIAVQRLTIKAFSDSRFFLSILNEIYDLEKCDLQDIFSLYEICEGYPQRLKTFLRNLYIQDGIEYSKAGKAIIIEDKLKEHILNKLIDFDFNMLPLVERFIVQIVAAWGTPIDLKRLNEFIAYFSNIDPTYSSFSDSVISRAILSLEDSGILYKQYESGGCFIKFKHDSIYAAMEQLLKKKGLIIYFLHHSMFYFIRQYDSSFSESELEFLLAYHSYEGNCDNWIDINYEYGLKLHKSNQYARARVVFSRLDKEISKLSSHQKLVIAINCYCYGDYDNAIFVVEQIDQHDLSRANQMECQIYFVKSLLMQFQYERSIDVLDKALECELFEDEKIELMRLKLLTLCLIPNGYDESKKLFDKIVTEYNNSLYKLKLLSVYRVAVDYRKGEESFDLLYKGLELADELADEEEYAKHLHNIGFEHFRCGDYQKAKACFNDSARIIEQYKKHNISYCLNNLAVIEMVSENWDKALDLLKEAYFWNKSTYATLTIKGNIMLCYHYLNMTKYAAELREELLAFLDTYQCIDDKIYKKILTNAAVMYCDKMEFAVASTLLARCIPYLKTESPLSSARVKKLQKYIGISQYDNCNSDEKFYNYYYNLPFEPWVLTFGNE